MTTRREIITSGLGLAGIIAAGRAPAAFVRSMVAARSAAFARSGGGAHEVEYIGRNIDGAWFDTGIYGTNQLCLYAHIVSDTDSAKYNQYFGGTSHWAQTYANYCFEDAYKEGRGYVSINGACWLDTNPVFGSNVDIVVDINQEKIMIYYNSRKTVDKTRTSGECTTTWTMPIFGMYYGSHDVSGSGRQRWIGRIRFYDRATGEDVLLLAPYKDEDGLICYRDLTNDRYIYPTTQTGLYTNEG